MYFLFFYITIFTPFHSDDYSYYLKGLSFETHISHYLNWSGRFVADYLSSLLLATKSQLLTAMIRSLVCSLLVVLIFKIGFNRDSINKTSATDQTKEKRMGTCHIRTTASFIVFFKWVNILIIFLVSF